MSVTAEARQIPDDVRRIRIGAMFAATAALMLALAVTEPFGDEAWKAWVVLVVFGATGGGLLLRVRVARVPAALMFAAGAVLTIHSFIVVVEDSWPPDAVDVDWALAIANAAATTLLLIWLCIRGLQVMLTTTRPRLTTVRLVGAGLAIVAIDHLWMAYRIGFEWRGAWSLTISPDGSRFVGFPGWPIWHVALLVTALALVGAPRRLLPHAAGGLAVLFAILLPLVIVAGMRVALFDLPFVVVALALTLLPAALAWWLRDELRHARGGPGGQLP